jgi:hypothetical protein
MSTVAAVLPIVVRPWVAHAARGALLGRSRSPADPTAGRFTRRDVDDLVRVAFAGLAEQRARLPEEPTLGSRQNVVFAALTLAFLDALTRSGVARDHAIELTADICWRIYRRWGQAAAAVARVAVRDPARRLAFSVETFLRYPFNRPGYRYDDVGVPDGRGLDMHRCPVADYLGARGASDLALGAWCSLDYALAEQWHGHLERSGTIAGGSSCCDFRFRAGPGPKPT